MERGQTFGKHSHFVARLLIASVFLLVAQDARAAGFCKDWLRILGRTLTRRSVDPILQSAFGNRSETDSLSSRDKLYLFDEITKAANLPSDPDLNWKAATLAAKSRTPGFLRFLLNAPGHVRSENFPKEVFLPAFLRDQAASNPFSTGYRLGNERERINALLGFQHLLSLDPRAARVAANSWVTTPERALYLYQHLGNFGVHKARLLSDLIDRNDFFQDAVQLKDAPSSLITHSFELETSNSKIRSLYRDARLSDSEWFLLPENTQKTLLSELIGKKKKVYQPASRIAPTSLKPSVLGGLSKDGTGYEVAHQSYDFSATRLIQEMRGVAYQLSAKYGFHVHSVFELPKDYPHMDRFAPWIKQWNDYLHLRGLEERLMDTSGVKLPAPAGAKAHRVLPDSERYASDEVPNRLAPINSWRYKNFTAAVRGNIYGEPSLASNKRIGIELRGATQGLDLYLKYLTALRASIRDRIWEKSPVRKEGQLDLLSPVRQFGDIVHLESLGLSERFIRQLGTIAPSAAMPLRNFSEQEYFDYQSGKNRLPTRGEIRRLDSARASYVEELKKIHRWWKTGIYGLRGEDGRSAMRHDLDQALVEWTKASHLSDLYSGLNL